MLVVAGGESTPLLEVAVAAFDDVTALVVGDIEPDGSSAARPAALAVALLVGRFGDRGLDAAGAQVPAASRGIRTPYRPGPRRVGCGGGRRDERQVGAPSAAGTSASRRPAPLSATRPAGGRCHRRASGSSSTGRRGSGRPPGQAARRPDSCDSIRPPVRRFVFVAC